jgi:peptidoglycan/xylan/chitin deacetylase (PgdA/CDA1 family)
MIECIFTIDYEIYGNGEGSLRELVYEPALKLTSIFDQAGVKFVVFVEAAEFEKIGACESDPAVNNVQHQIRELHERGHEIALHLHPQWYNASYHGGKWNLDYSEYNLCTLPEKRISEIVDRSINYLKKILSDSGFTPFSFRAGNWLFQPTRIAAKVLAERGIKIDSSVFKGGRQHKHRLDYRPAIKNGYFWEFQDDVNVPTSNGAMLEIPIYTCMVPFWKMATAKRIGLQQKANSSRASIREIRYRIFDRARLFHPMKFDFCRMSLVELTTIVEQIIREDKIFPATIKPIVAIGHTKDLVDFETVKYFLSYLKTKGIVVSTFEGVYSRCKC